MRQVKDIRQRLQKGDYAFIKCGETLLFALMYNETDWAFYSKSDSYDLNGSNMPLYDEVKAGYPMLNEYTSSWILHTYENDTIARGIADLRSDCEVCEDETLSIVTDDMNPYGQKYNYITDLHHEFRENDYTWLRCDTGSEIINLLVLHYGGGIGVYSSTFNLCGSDKPRRISVRKRHPFVARFTSSLNFESGEVLHTLLGKVNMMIESRHDVDIEVETLVHSYSLGLWENERNTLTTTQQEEIMEFINKNYTEECMYTGIHGYHSHHGGSMNLPKRKYTYRMGIELEVEFDNSRLLGEFTDKQSNWFFCEHDGSLGSNGCEIITIPMHPKDAKDVEQWKELTNYLSDKAISWDTGRCGLHVHIGREILGKSEEQRSETIGKLLYLYHHFVKDTRLNIAVYGRDVAYNDRDGKTDIGNSAKTLGSEVFKSKDICNKVKDAMVSKSSHARYFDVNLMNEHTIEFRKGKGSLRPERIAMVVEYSEKLCLYAKHTPWVQISYVDFVNYLKSTDCSAPLKDMIETRA